MLLTESMDLREADKGQGRHFLFRGVLRFFYRRKAFGMMGFGWGFLINWDTWDDRNARLNGVRLPNWINASGTSMQQ
jgi:hypothetical protein